MVHALSSNPSKGKNLSNLQTSKEPDKEPATPAKEPAPKVESHSGKGPPALQSVPKPRAKRDFMSGFEHNLHSQFVVISTDGLKATYVGSKADDYQFHGGVLGNGPLQSTAEGKYFQVRISKIMGGPPDGLVIGVTMQSPDGVEKIPEFMDELDPSWLAGYDGQFWDGAHSVWHRIPWDAKALKIDDRVGFLVTPHGEIRLNVNGREVMKQNASISSSAPLFAVVDLLGCTCEVELEPSAQPKRVSDDSKKTPHVRALPMTGFLKTKAGVNVKVSSDGLAASYIGSDKDEMNGIVLGDGPIPVLGGNAYFEVQIEEVGHGHSDGLAIGVTTCAESAIRELPEVSDGIHPCWLAGFDGCYFDGQRETWIDVSWKSSDLCVNDKVGCLVSDCGQMVIYVNGSVKVEAVMEVPKEPLFAVIDLIGNTNKVSFIPGSKHPDKSTIKRKTHRSMRMMPLVSKIKARPVMSFCL